MPHSFLWYRDKRSPPINDGVLAVAMFLLVQRLDRLDGWGEAVDDWRSAMRSGQQGMLNPHFDRWLDRDEKREVVVSVLEGFLDSGEAIDTATLNRLEVGGPGSQWTVPISRSTDRVEPTMRELIEFLKSGS